VDSVSLVACISDFGSEDFYAGALRGVLAGALPRGSVVDVTQHVPAGDVLRAGLILWEVQPSFPPGTVFLAVVDPGVGGGRRAAVFHFPECDVVCPDNGIATFLMERFPEYHAVEIDPRRMGFGPLSNTFHGRDLFAPAAARLASGTPFASFGPALSSPHKLPLPRLQGEAATGWEGEALYSDHFGNIITSIGRIGYDFRELSPWIETGARGGAIQPHARVELGDGSTIPIGTTYSDARGGPRRIAVVGSNGLLEIAAWQSAAGADPLLQPGSAIRLIPPA
jgi:S-adenosyl-L-methionine hydrolase (adenosine-forming)